MTITITEETAASDAAAETVLCVRGTIDLSTAATLAQRLADVVRSPGASVVVDLAGVTFLDSTGLSALVTGELTATERGSTMVLTRLPTNVRSLLHLTGLDQVLRIRESPDRSG